MYVSGDFIDAQGKPPVAASTLSIPFPSALCILAPEGLRLLQMQ